MKEFDTTERKAHVVINVAPIKDVKALKNALLKEFKNNNLGLKMTAGEKTSEILDRTVDITGFLDFIKNILIGIDTSEELERALAPCLARCTYNSIVINDRLWDEQPEALNDYYEVLLACIEANLSPFLKSLRTALKGDTFPQILSLISTLTQMS